MNVTASLGQIQAILALLFVVALLYAAVALAGSRKTRQGDMAGSWSTVGAMGAPIVLACIALGGLALAIGTGLLSSIGIGG